MNASDRLTNSLQDVLELQQFLHDFIAALTKRNLQTGEDVTHLVKEHGLKLPAALEGAPITGLGVKRAPMLRREIRGGRWFWPDRVMLMHLD
jgi:hypothetical protein